MIHNGHGRRSDQIIARPFAVLLNGRASRARTISSGMSVQGMQVHSALLSTPFLKNQSQELEYKCPTASHQVNEKSNAERPPVDPECCLGYFFKRTERFRVELDLI